MNPSLFPCHPHMSQSSLVLMHTKHISYQQNLLGGTSTSEKSWRCISSKAAPNIFGVYCSSFFHIVNFRACLLSAGSGPIVRPGGPIVISVASFRQIKVHSIASLTLRRASYFHTLTVIAILIPIEEDSRMGIFFSLGSTAPLLRKSIQNYTRHSEIKRIRKLQTRGHGNPRPQRMITTKPHITTLENLDQIFMGVSSACT